MKNICLATLEQATAQEVFDWVAFNLLTQGKKSINEFGDIETCAYRGSDGLKCAAGWLISDFQYKERMENIPWSGLVMDGEVSGKHFGLICLLQNIHDSYEPKEWHEKFSEVAKDFRLATKVLDRFG